MKFRKLSNKKYREGSEGVRTLFLENPKLIGLLGFEIRHYGRNFSRSFPEFSIHFSFFIIHSFYVSHSGLKKLTKYFSFC